LIAATARSNNSSIDETRPSLTSIACHCEQHIHAISQAISTAEQIDSTRRSEECQRLQNRVQLIADGLRVTDAFVDEGLAQVMKQYADVLGDLD
jgi:predicted secreted Zn-dependent protease